MGEKIPERVNDLFIKCLLISAVYQVESNNAHKQLKYNLTDTA